MMATKDELEHVKKYDQVNENRNNSANLFLCGLILLIGGGSAYYCYYNKNSSKKVEKSTQNEPIVPKQKKTHTTDF